MLHEVQTDCHGSEVQESQNNMIWKRISKVATHLHNVSVTAEVHLGDEKPKKQKETN